MKVLLVSHNYPPRHLAGTEVYTANLARELIRRGHTVLVFTSEKEVSLPHGSSREREHEGVPVLEVINNLHYKNFKETWDLPAVDRIFEDTVQRFAPDVVHIQHLMYLSVGIAEMAAAQGAGVVYSLHDFWLECPRFGQRVHAEGSICHTINVARCAECLASSRLGNSALEQRVGGFLAALRSATGVDLAAPVRLAGDWLRARGEKTGVASDPVQLAGLEADLRERAEGLRSRLLPVVDRFLAPSAFLARELGAWGLPREKLTHLKSGVDIDALQAAPKSPRGKNLRVGFLGTLAPIKGAHILLGAWARLSPEACARGELVIHGPSTRDLEYAGRLQELAAKSSARLAGALARDEVPGALARIDLLVVPSLWYENQPLVILEALAVRTPVLVSDLGGMAELVHDGREGFRFPVGDEEALAELLEGLLQEPERLDGLFASAPDVPSLAEQTDAILKVYDSVRGAR